MRDLALLAICASALLSASPASAQDDISVKWRAYGQFTAERTDGDDAVEFGTERLRPRVVVESGRFSGLAQFDFAVSNLGDAQPGLMSNVVMDAHVDYRFASGGRLRFGQYKTPLGMDFNTPAHLLDLTKRGMEYGLTLNRDIGLMYTGNPGGRHFSYDVGLFNPPGRSAATQYEDSQVGQDDAAVARLRFDDGPWHAEAATGKAAHAGGPGSGDYDVQDLAVHYAAERWFAKFEWIEGDAVRGQAGRTERVYFVHGSYALSPSLSLVARHYEGRSDVAGNGTDLANTYLGVTWWPAKTGRFQSRLQVNYVRTGGDTASYTGVRGFRDDAIFAQFQLYVESK